MRFTTSVMRKCWNFYETYNIFFAYVLKPLYDLQRTCWNLQPQYTCFNNAAVHHSEPLIRFRFDRSKLVVPFRSQIAVFVFSFHPYRYNLYFAIFISNQMPEKYTDQPKETKSNIKWAVAWSMHRIAFNISPVKVTVCIEKNHQRSFLHSLTKPYQGLNVYMHYNPHR